jgi:transketolase
MAIPTNDRHSLSYDGPLCVESNSSEPWDYVDISRRVRADIIRLSYEARTHHISSALSCVDILVALYFGYMTLKPRNTGDVFILSKGHAALALYTVLAARGVLPIPRLRVFGRRRCASGLGLHPMRECTLGVEATTGSLGHGLSLGAGRALASKTLGLQSRSIVLLGDGELNEGAIWEGAAFAAHHMLGNLIVIVDRNSMQCLGRTSEILRMESIADRFGAFGWATREVDGHDSSAILATLRGWNSSESKPLAVVAHTTKGKGVSFMENSVAWHHQRLVLSDFRKAMSELGVHEI